MTTIRNRFLKLATFSVTKEISSFDISLYDLGADSLDIVELVMAVEEEFKLEVPDSDVFKDAHSMHSMNPLQLDTINDWVAYIESKANG